MEKNSGPAIAILPPFSFCWTEEDNAEKKFVVYTQIALKEAEI